MVMNTLLTSHPRLFEGAPDAGWSAAANLEAELADPELELVDLSMTPKFQTGRPYSRMSIKQQRYSDRNKKKVGQS